MTGYLCACGNALPSDTPCGCTADCDDPRIDECTCSDPAVRERHERAWENSRDFDPTKRWPPKSATPRLPAAGRGSRRMGLPSLRDGHQPDAELAAPPGTNC
jgi:hypothetical protein